MFTKIIALTALLGLAIVTPAAAHNGVVGPTVNSGGCSKKGVNDEENGGVWVFGTTTNVSGCSIVQAKICTATGLFQATGASPQSVTPPTFSHSYYTDHNGLAGTTWHGFRLTRHAGISC